LPWGRIRRASPAEQLLDAARRAKLATAQMTTAGTLVTDLRSTFLTGDQTYCLFRRPLRAGRETSQRHRGPPYERIVATVHVATEDLR
jgi:hypothetical protein